MFSSSTTQVTDMYDDIDLIGTKGSQLKLQKRELNSIDMHEDDAPPLQKRARLDINYSIGPAGSFQNLNGSQQPHHQQQQQQNRRKMTLVNRIV